MTDRPQLAATVHRLDGELRRLNGPRVDLVGPGLLDLYRGGGDDDREWVRELLRQCRTFRWAVGRGVGLPQPPIGPEAAAQALALFSMKDGDADYRDQQLWLDGLCASLSKSGLDVAALLRQAAGWSSDAPRFPPAWSTRTLLLDYARRSATRP